MSSPTCEFLYAGLLYVSLKRFWQNTRVALDPICHDNEYDEIPCEEYELQWYKFLSDELSEFRTMTKVKGQVEVDLDQELIDLCRGTCTEIKRAGDRFLEDIDKWSTTDRPRFRISVGRDSTPFFKRYNGNMSEMSKVYANIKRVLAGLRKRYPDIDQMSWRTQ